MHRSFFGYLAVALVLLAIVLALAFIFLPGQVGGDEIARIVQLVGLLALIGAGVVVGVVHQPGRALRDALIWAVIFAALVTGYGFRHEFTLAWQRFTGELTPSRAVSDTNGTVTLRRAHGGHYLADARVNNAPVRFLVDTGASHVILSAEDASRAGYDLAALSFTRRYQTANGIIFAAPVTLDEVRLGSLRMRNVAAAVVESDVGGSLLGMSFLNRLSRFEVTRDTLILTP